jgi:hypothetical protein
MTPVMPWKPIGADTGAPMVAKPVVTPGVEKPCMPVGEVCAASAIAWAIAASAMSVGEVLTAWLVASS